MSPIKSKFRQSKYRLVLLVISVAVLGLAAGATAWRIYSVPSSPEYDRLIVLPEPRIIADFALTDQSGMPFSLEDFKGHWSLLFFGFTSCPDICPNTLFQLKQARQLMAEHAKAEDLPRVYLVSVDPERDTPEKLDSYLDYFDPAFFGLTGADEQLKALAFQAGIAYFVEPHRAGDLEYNVDHSASLLLLDPQGRLYGVLPSPHNAEQIADDILVTIRQES